MGIIELLTLIGEDEVKVQHVNSSLISAKDSAKHGDTELTIATAETNTNELTRNAGKVGLLVWVDRDKFNKHFGK